MLHNGSTSGTQMTHRMNMLNMYNLPQRATLNVTMQITFSLHEKITYADK